MKRISQFLICLSILMTQARTQQPPLLVEAFGKGNAAVIAQYFHSSIELSVPQKDGAYSKAQAHQILQEFFLHHKARSFELQHQGQSTEHSRYMIGALQTDNGTFRVYALLKVLGGEELIHILRFDRNS
jgi:hypothetical protein